MASSERSTHVAFRRWCTHQDLDALAAFFDEVAPKLLRVAMHVAPDPAEAEDLVQSAFLTLMENRASLDPDEDGVAWLAVVLRRRAIDRMRRASARPAAEDLDLDAILASVEDAAGPAERRELQSEVLRAVDRLKEPYRQPVLLRLRHGASAAEIAHLLDRSPSTIAVQLHRGLRELRRLLPASFAVSLASAMRGTGALGLEGVRSLVLDRGAAQVAASSSPVFLGGPTLVSVKTVAATGACVLVALSLLAVMNGSSRSGRTDGPSEVTREGPIALAESRAPAVEPSPARFERTERTATSETAAPDADFYSGVVIDGASGERIAGARVEIFAPTRLTPREAVKQFPALFRTTATGEVESRMPVRRELDPDPEAVRRRPGSLHITAGGRPVVEIPPTWPLLEGVSRDARFEDRLVKVLGLPPVDAAPLARGRSGKSGEFEVRASIGTSSGRCLLRVTAAGRAPRTLTAVPGERVLVDLLRPGRVAGKAIGADGEPVSVRLALIGSRGSPSAEANAKELRDALRLPGGLEIVEVTTDASGWFQAEIGAADLLVQSLDPKWVVRGWSLTVGGAEGRVDLRPEPLFRFVDARDGRPIDRVAIRIRDRRDGYVSLSGTYDTNDGLLGTQGYDLSYFLGNATLELTAWGRRHAPTRVDLPDVLPDHPIEVRLQPGGAPEATGLVRRGKAPVRGALVELLGTRRLQWHRDEDHCYDGTRTDEKGRFTLAGPDGPTAIRVETSEGAYVEAIALPLERPLSIDLDALGAIHVAVRSALGVPCEDHVVEIHSVVTGFFERAYTDEHGVARFERLGPDSLLVTVPAASKTGSPSGDFTQEVSIVRGEERRIEFVIPDASTPRFLRIDAGEEAYSGWHARTERSHWIEIDSDGTVPIDLATEAQEMRIAAVDGRRWRFHFPTTAPDGTVIELGRGSGALKGTLVDDTGAPLAGVAVIVHSMDPTPDHGDRCVAITDATGHFEMTGLRRQSARITLRDDPEAMNFANDGRIDGTQFTLSEPIGDDTWVELEVPRITARVSVTGRVLDRDGKPRDDVRVAVEARIRSGALTCRPAKAGSFQGLDESGGFRIELPRTNLIEVAVYPLGVGEALHRETVEVPAAGPLPPIEIRLP
ncbi:MAG: sigma-70 family RNA polymerase sigma factor [Planctomycetota bacterium]